MNLHVDIIHLLFYNETILLRDTVLGDAPAEWYLRGFVRHCYVKEAVNAWEEVKVSDAFIVLG